MAEKEEKEEKEPKGTNEKNLEKEQKPSKLEIIKKYKNIIIIVILIIVFIVIAIIWRKNALNNEADFELINSTTEIAEIDKGKPVETYFRFTGNSLYEFRQLDGSSQNKSRFVTYYNETKIQYAVYRPSIAKHWYTVVFEVKDGEIRRLYNSPNYEHNLNMIEEGYDYNQEPTIILKEPVVLGNSWKIGIDDVYATITNLDYEVRTANGLYKTVEVTTDFKNGNYRKDYFSETNGLVRSVDINSDGTKNSVELVNVEPLSSGLDRAMYVYYLRSDNFVGEQTLVEFKEPTNKPITEIFREILSSTDEEGLKPLISPYTKINKISIDKDSKYVHVDFSKEFYAYSSQNKNTESKHMVALANTFCRYYQVLNCKITIDGKPYTTKNYQFGEDDTIKAIFR